MAKVQIKSEKLTPFGGIFSIMEQFDALLAQTIDSSLGLRCTMFGYQYSEILRSLMCVYLCGGSCIEDVTTHLMKHLSLHPTLRTCSADTILRAIEELTCKNITYKSASGKSYDFNTADKMNCLLVNALLATGQLKSGQEYDFDFAHQFIETEKYDAKPTYKKFLGYSNYAKDKKYNFSDVNITSKGMNGNPAAYDHSTKILSFLTSNAINNTTYPEEFIHMNQDNVYFGGIGTYEKTAMLNIEFESKFIQDVIHAPYGTQLVGSGNKYYNSYINWVYSFNPTSSFPNFTAVESGYNNISWWQFAQDFKESSPSPYKDYVMSNVLVAKLIDIIGNNFGKNTKSIALASSKNSTILPQSFKYKGKTFIVKENIIKNAQNKISFANIAVSSTLKINKCIPVDSIVRQVFSKERIKYLAERNEKIICLTVFDGQSGKIEEVSFSLTFAPDITEKEIFNLEQIIKNQLFSFEDTNTQEHYRFVQAIDFTLLNK